MSKEKYKENYFVGEIKKQKNNTTMALGAIIKLQVSEEGWKIDESEAK